MRFSVLLSAAALILIAPFSTRASDASLSHDYLNFSAGIYNTLHNDDLTTGQLGAEYRFREWDFGVRPTIGVLASWSGAYYGYAGFNWDVPLISNRLYLTPSVMVGGYHKGGGKDLGGPIEFREGIELSYQFDNAQRLGLAFTHMSNANIYDHNSGVEALLVEYSVPLSSVMSHLSR